MFSLSLVCFRESCSRPDPKLDQVSAETPCPPPSAEFRHSQYTGADQEYLKGKLWACTGLKEQLENQHHSLAQSLS